MSWGCSHVQAVVMRDFVHDELFAHTLSLQGIQHHLYGGILCNSMAQSSPERQKGWEDSRQSRKISIELENILSI